VLKRGKQTLQRQQRYRESFEEGVRAGNAMVDNRMSLPPTSQSITVAKIQAKA